MIGAGAGSIGLGWMGVFNMSSDNGAVLGRSAVLGAEGLGAEKVGDGLGWLSVLAFAEVGLSEGRIGGS
jgi:hypothetical protein